MNLALYQLSYTAITYKNERDKRIERLCNFRLPDWKSGAQPLGQPRIFLLNPRKDLNLLTRAYRVFVIVHVATTRTLIILVIKSFRQLYHRNPAIKDMGLVKISIWRYRMESNHRPRDLEALALPIELLYRLSFYCITLFAFVNTFVNTF